MIFCDTSAAVKIYLAEREYRAVQRLFQAEDELCLSELARVEMMGIFHRLLREGIWTQTDFLAAVRQFSNDEISGFWTWLPLDKPIIDAAAKTYATLPRTVFLRSSDCLHLVTALHHNFDEIYTYDTHQSAAAAVLGLKAVSA
ncbi:MAG: type II toxin-antitoxin system VapC family toxin [Methylacidiphilales bacterium]|nr:type II toxin-antitoxin system VapC family toxin [Candidatus Methylacidiphilales bacterium]